MINRDRGFSTGYFTLSVVLHCLAVLGIFMAPQLELLDEGSGHAIDFIAMDEPKGEQLETPVVGDTDVVVENPVKKPIEAPAAPKDVKQAESPVPPLEDLKPKNEPPLPENLDSEISNEEPKIVKIAKELPDKKEVALPEPPPEETPIPEQLEDTKVDDFLAEESDAVTEEAETAALIVDVGDSQNPVEEPKPEPAEETAAIAKEEEPVPEIAPEEEDPFEEKSTEAAVAAVPTPENTNQKPVVDNSLNSQAANESATTVAAPAVAQNQSSTAYGKPSGKVRSYLDLSQVRGNKAPSYPTLARRMNQQGQVKLAYYVNSDGSVGNMKLVQSSGYKLLDKEAVRAVSQYRYKPGQAGWTLHPVNFQLQGPVKKMPSRLRTSRR